MRRGKKGMPRRGGENSDVANRNGQVFSGKGMVKNSGYKKSFAWKKKEGRGKRKEKDRAEEKKGGEAESVRGSTATPMKQKKNDRQNLGA